MKSWGLSVESMGKCSRQENVKQVFLRFCAFSLTLPFHCNRWQAVEEWLVTTCDREPTLQELSRKPPHLILLDFLV